MKAGFTILLIISAWLSPRLSKAQTLLPDKSFDVTSKAVVPSGKVWKFEGGVGEAHLNYQNQEKIEGLHLFNVYLNDRLITVGFSDSLEDNKKNTSTAGPDESSVYYQPLPMWLPEGSSISPGPETEKIFIVEYSVNRDR